jgi:peroxiredoxin family protein
MAPKTSTSKFCLILFSGDFDKAMAALTMANGAAGNGLDVTLFFTFWGINLLRKQYMPGKRPLENLFKRMMPIGVSRISLSKMNFCGIGPWLMKRLIRQKDGQTASDLFTMAMDRKIHFIACEASLKLLGISKAELIDYPLLEIAGVDAFLSTARESEVTLFV